MKNLIIIAIAVGGFSLGTMAQVEKKEKAKPTTYEQVKKPTVQKKVVNVDKKSTTKFKSAKKIKTSNPVLIQNKQKVKQQQRLEESESKSKVNNGGGLTQDKIDHAEEKSNGKAFSGNGKAKKSKKVKKSKVEKKSK